jgi:predicted nucleotidyltransferase
VIIRDTEKNSIAKSIEALQARVSIWFGADVSSQFIFGSYTRGTILPRRIDAKSDIDYMIVFADTSLRPQTYMNKLKTFVEHHYSSSSIAQSSPTIVLNLNHIRFELVPAIDSWFGGLQIPAPASDFSDWISTSPNDFNRTLTEKNNAHGYKIKPAIRLVKYWNATNGYVFPSYELEQALVEQWFWGCKTVTDYFYSMIEELSLGIFSAQWRQAKLQRAKDIVAQAKHYESQGKPLSAEQEIEKLLPDFV